MSSSRAAVLVFLGMLSMAGRASAVELQRDSYLSYVPDLGGNTALAVIYTILAIALYYHLFFTGAKVDKWALCLPIGTTFEALGFYLRIPMRTQQHNMPLYTVMYLFVVLSPAAFLAFNYILFGRLVAALEGNKPGAIRHSSPYSFIPPRWVKRIFVVSDVCTFCVQAAGGGMQTSNDYKTSETGNNVFLGGVVGQGASYLLFTALTLVAHYRLLSWHGKRYAPTNLREPAVVLLNILYISSIGILVRSVYRIIEMAQGYRGELYSTEIYTFLLDALPLVIAIGVYAPLWPGVLLRRIRDNALAERGAGPGNAGSTHMEDGMAAAGAAGGNERGIETTENGNENEKLSHSASPATSIAGSARPGPAGTSV